jgi:hypothetical protein
MVAPPFSPATSGKPPMGASPLGVPSANPGSQAASISQMREAIKILEKALPGLQLGSEPHTATLNAIKALARHASPSSEIPGVQQTELRNLQASAGKDAALQQLMRSMGSTGGPAGQAPGAPAGGTGMTPPPAMGA